MAGLVAVGLLMLAPTPALAVNGYEYKLHFTGEGKETMTSTSTIVPQESRHQKATWTFLPRDVDVWLPQFNGPPGEANAKEEEFQTADERVAQGPYAPIGQVEDTGTYFDEEGTEPEEKSFSCAAPIMFVGPIIHRVIVTPLDPTIELETDFHGVLGTVNHGVASNTIGEPCYTTSKGEEGHGYFNFRWDEPHGQRLQVGMLINATEIGQPFIAGPAEDYNNVVQSESAEGCLEGIAHNCEVTFKLSGEYDLQLICGGTLAGGAWSCGGGSGTGQGPSNTNNNSNSNNGKPGGGEEAKPKGPASSAQAVPQISSLKLSPDAFPAAKEGASIARAQKTGTTVSYTDSLVGSTATFAVEEKRSGFLSGRKCLKRKPGHTRKLKRCSYEESLGTFTHLDSTGLVSFHFTGRVGGRSLTPGDYLLVAHAMSSAGKQGGGISAPFRIARK
jgi:hypothetical protein